MTAVEHDAEVIDLEEFLAGDAPDFDVAPTPPPDLDTAERYLRRYARLQAQADQAIELANTQRARIDLWLANELHRIGAQQSWFEQALTSLHASILADNPKAKTVNLPSGKLRARAQQPEWVFDDEAAFMAWAVEHRPELVTVPEPPAPRPAKVAVKKALSPRPDAPVGSDSPAFDPATGEEVPGVHVLIRGTSHSIDLTGPVDDEDGDAA